MALWNTIPKYKKNKKNWSGHYLTSARWSKAPCQRSKESAVIPDVSAARIQPRNIRRCIWLGKRIKRPKHSISQWLTRKRLNSGVKTIKNWKNRLEKSQISTKNCFDQNKPLCSRTAPSATSYWVITKIIAKPIKIKSLHEFQYQIHLLLNVVLILVQMRHFSYNVPQNYWSREINTNPIRKTPHPLARRDPGLPEVDDARMRLAGLME